jgi:hypothetical protein
MARDQELADIERILAILAAMRPEVRKRSVGFILQRLDTMDPKPEPVPMVPFRVPVASIGKGGDDDNAA